MLRREIRRLRGCLSVLSRFERRVLTLRAGVGGRRPLSSARVARRLRAPRQRVIDAEHLGLARLRAAGSIGACDGGGTATGASAGGGPLVASTASGPGALVASVVGPTLGAPDETDRSLAAAPDEPGRTLDPSVFLDQLGPRLSALQLVTVILLLSLGIVALARARRRA